MVRQIGKRNLEVHSSADIVGFLPTIGAAAQINVARITVEVRQGIVTVTRYQTSLFPGVNNATTARANRNIIEATQTKRPIPSIVSIAFRRTP